MSALNWFGRTGVGVAITTVVAAVGLVLFTAPPDPTPAAPVATQLVKPHETSLSCSRELLAGSTTAIRCGVHAVKSLAETLPVANADVQIQLRAPETTYPLFVGKTQDNGFVEAPVKIPELPSGKYTLVVSTRSARGKETLQQAVQIKSEPKILLVTDKPLYQPGQLIHIRALALRQHDLKPVDGAKLVFEVEDPKGNKVFKRTQHTSQYGVASIDFQLADEINMGAYQVRASIGNEQVDKTVTIKKYVLPKFQVELTTDKQFYLPQETIHADLQADYFFGKPLAGAKVKVTASTFDVQFREFQTWEGQTDTSGHASLEIKLPKYFVGQPLQQGNAMVQLAVEITDAADHTEKISKDFPVSDQPIRVNLIAEGGRLVPEVENRIFAATTYPDGSPAECEVLLWTGRETEGKPAASAKTNESGLAEFKITPRADQFRQADWKTHNIELLGGTQQVWRPGILFDLAAEAKDAKGNHAMTRAELSSEPFGENVLLRMDKAVYQGGEVIGIDITTSAGLPTAYLDIIKNGQTALTRWLDVKDGKAHHQLSLPPAIFGTLEVHAYQMLASGEIIRDSRVVYVHPAQELRIDVTADKQVYLPGQQGRIRFQVSDSDGKPTAAALGVVIVDEAVYALQDMQPGLEKVYFTLQQELLKPQVEIHYGPQEPIDALVRQPRLSEQKQQIARALLASVRPRPPARWEVAPAVERSRKMQQQIQQIGWAVLSLGAATNKPLVVYDRTAKRWVFREHLLDELQQAGYLNKGALSDPFGGELTLEQLAQLEPRFTADRLASAVTHHHLQQLFWAFVHYTNANRQRWFKNGRWEFPESVLADAARQRRLHDVWRKDAWGREIRLVKLDKKSDHKTGQTQLDNHTLVSAGPDGKFGTKDDVKIGDMADWYPGWGMALWWDPMFANGYWARWGGRQLSMRALLREEAQMGGGMGGARGLAVDRLDAAAMPPPAAPAADASKTASPAAVRRVREYFPETMLWQPALITDERGMAELPLELADSITTWRLSAAASSRGGLLGGVSVPLRVFQDFFVDIDLPVNLTRNDEVAFPVAVYNYLKEPQTVRLELQPDRWFELIGEGDYRRSLTLQPNEVTSVKFRIRARRVGNFPLLVKAFGSKMSDAVKRQVEVVPDGQKIEQVVTDRLADGVVHMIDIPETAVPESYKLIVKLYPGVMSQVIEGAEGLLRMPFG